MSATPEEAIAAVTELFGEHERSRAVHAKGIVCAGSFTATPEAAELTRAAHMQGASVPVTVRFSNAGGNPGAPDYAPDGRGMATKFYLEDGSRTDIVAVSIEPFLVSNPDDFIKFTRAAKPIGGTEIPGPRLLFFAARRPKTLKALAKALPAQKPPVSYATARYNGIHAFKWVDASGDERFVRYRWIPDAGEHSLSPRAAKENGRDYLQTELAERLAGGGARFSLVVQIAEPGDPIDDPGVLWPSSRRTVTVGHLELDRLDDQRERGDDILVFDPTRVTDGIELSNDPILRFRTRAYSVSIKRRSGAGRGADAPAL